MPLSCAVSAGPVCPIRVDPSAIRPGNPPVIYLLRKGCYGPPYFAVGPRLLAGPSGTSNSAGWLRHATCPLDLNQGHSHKLRLQVAFEHIAQDQLRTGTDQIAFGQIRRPDHDEIETINRNVQLRADYTLTQRWSLALALPLLQRRHTHISTPEHNHDESDHSHSKLVASLQQEAEGQLQEWDFARPGDLTLWNRFSPRDPIDAAIGISAPTGQTDIDNDDGANAEPALQPGIGAWGLIVEASFQRVFDNRSGRLFASTSYRFNGRGVRDYRFGSEWLLHAGGHYSLGGRLDLLGQFVAAWRDRDKAGRTGERTDATGGIRLYLSPGLHYGLGPKISLYGYYQFSPLRGPELDPTHRRPQFAFRPKLPTRPILGRHAPCNTHSPACWPLLS